MCKRLLDKNNPPSENFIREYIGMDSYAQLLQFEDFLSSHYHMNRELKFPFGNHYGWGYKYCHKSSHLCYVFFESGAFTVTLQLGDNCVDRVNEILPCLSHKANDLWKSRYICGEQGGWVHDRIMNVNDLNDVFELVKIKKKPVKKQ